MFFSIVIPIYNKSYSIHRLITSLNNQTYDKFEVIFINDGSTDNSLTILQDELNLHPNLFSKSIIISQENQGVSVARNNGIMSSRYNHICFLDADDTWDPTFLHYMSDLIETFPDAGAYSLGHRKIVNNKIITPQKNSTINFKGYLSNYFLSALKDDVINSSKVCILKKSIISVGLFPIGITTGEDLLVWALLALKYPIVYHDIPLANIYYENDDARVMRKNTIPYPVIYFGKHKHLLNPSLKLYLFKLNLAHMTTSLIYNNRHEAIIRWKAHKNIGFFSYISLGLTLLIPQKLLNVIFRRYRKNRNL